MLRLGKEQEVIATTTTNATSSEPTVTQTPNVNKENHNNHGGRATAAIDTIYTYYQKQLAQESRHDLPLNFQ